MIGRKILKSIQKKAQSFVCVLDNCSKWLLLDTQSEVRHFTPDAGLPLVNIFILHSNHYLKKNKCPFPCGSMITPR